jgi:hypothetical protein
LVRGLPLHAYIIQVTTLHSGNATHVLSTFLLNFILHLSNTDLDIGVAPLAHPQSLRSYCLFYCAGKFTLGALDAGIQQACHITNRKLCINSLTPSVGMSIFQSLLIHPKSDMVKTCSSHPLQPPPSAPGASNNLELMEFLKNMAESMEVLRKKNEDLNT